MTAFDDWRERRALDFAAKKRRAGKKKRRVAPPPPQPEPGFRIVTLAAGLPLRASPAARGLECGNTCTSLPLGAQVRTFERVTDADGAEHSKVALVTEAQLPSLCWVTSRAADGRKLLCDVVADDSVPLSADVATFLETLRAEDRAVEEAWACALSPAQFRVLRMSKTEEAHTGAYSEHFAPGSYECAACGRALYEAAHKFQSTCGWPSFADALPSALGRIPGRQETTRTEAKRPDEIRCASCDGHIGHVFASAHYPPPRHERHCANSICLRFVPDARCSESDLSA